MPLPRRSLSDLGAISTHGNGWRARVNIDGTRSSGPLRASEAEARADLERARQSATREEMSKYLEDCCRTAAGDVRPLAASPAAADLTLMAALAAPSCAAPAEAGSAGSATMPAPRPEAAPAVSPRTPRPAQGSCGADDAADATHAFTVHGAELALAMLHGYKLVENRDRKFSIGWYALHVGLQDTEHSRRAADMYPELLQGSEAGHFQGTIVGLVHIAEHRTKEECDGHAWAVGPVCNVLSASVLLDRPVAVRGNQGQWPLPAEVRDDVLEQIREGDCVPIVVEPTKRACAKARAAMSWPPRPR